MQMIAHDRIGVDGDSEAFGHELDAGFDPCLAVFEALAGLAVVAAEAKDRDTHCLYTVLSPTAYFHGSSVIFPDLLAFEEAFVNWRQRPGHPLFVSSIVVYGLFLWVIRYLPRSFCV
jgi:hypothetical protein